MECRVETPPVPGLRTLDSRAAPVHLLYGAVTVISIVRDSCFRGVLCFESEIREKERNLKRDISEVNVSSIFDKSTRRTNVNNSNSASSSGAHSADTTEMSLRDMSADFSFMVVEVLAVQHSQLLAAHGDGSERCPSPISSQSLRPSSLVHAAPSVTTKTWSNSSTAITVWARDESCPCMSVIDGIKPTCKGRGKFIEIILPLNPSIDQEGSPPAIMREETRDALPISAADDDDDAITSSPTSFPPAPLLETVPPLRHPLIASLMSVEVGHLLLLSGLMPADLLTGDEVSRSFLNFLSAKSSQCCPCCCCKSDSGNAVEGDGIDKAEGDHASLTVTASSLKLPYLEGDASLMSSSAPTGIYPVTLSITNISTLSALSSSPSLGCI